jgi:hypothetical protein
MQLLSQGSQQQSDGTSAQDAIAALLNSAGGPGGPPPEGPPLSQPADGSDPQAQFAQNLFSSIDTDGDGSITQSELETAVTKAGGSKESADALFSQLDPDGTGSVDETQFAQGIAPPDDGKTAGRAHGHHHHHHGAHGIGTDGDTDDDTTDTATAADNSSDDNLLSFFDTDGNGSVSKEELSQGFNQLRSQMMQFLIGAQSGQQAAA